MFDGSLNPQNLKEELQKLLPECDQNCSTCSSFITDLIQHIRLGNHILIKEEHESETEYEFNFDLESGISVEEPETIRAMADPNPKSNFENHKVIISVGNVKLENEESEPMIIPERIDENDLQFQIPPIKSKASKVSLQNPSSTESQTRRSFNLQFKLDVVEFTRTNSVYATAKKFNIAERSIRSWRKQKSLLEKLVHTKKKTNARRLEGSGKKLLDGHDAAILAWITEERRRNRRVYRRTIQEKAMELFHIFSEGSEKEFKASQGWLNKFLRRNNISLQYY